MFFNEEELNFIRETLKTHTFEETTLLFNEKFKRTVSISAIYRVCAIHKIKKPVHKSNKSVVQWLADFYYTTYESFEAIINRNKINAIKFKELLEADDLIHRRDEFYSMFKNANVADRLWVLIWENERKSI